MHLFDIDIPGKATYKESDTFAFGDLGLQVVDTDLGKFGLAICYDIRFPEMSLALSKLGAQVLLFPANFSPATGPLVIKIYILFCKLMLIFLKFIALGYFIVRKSFR